MKTAVILGAGAMGRKLAVLLNKNEICLLAYGDNNPSCHDAAAAVPVVSVEAALAYCPDLVCIGVAGRERSAALCEQARELRYNGKVLELCDLARTVDLRAATLFNLLPRLQNVPGDVAELGVYQGNFAWQINLAFADRTLHLFDTFEGFAQVDLEKEGEARYQQGKMDFSDTSAETVQARMPYPKQVVVHAGFFPDTAEGLEIRFAFVSLDADLYAPTLAALEYFMPRLSQGGMIFLHDYNNPRFSGVTKAVADYEAAHGQLMLLPLADLHGTAVIMKV